MRPTVLMAIAALVYGPDGHAYIDPNVGGWLYQLLFPLLIVIAGAWAVLRHRIAEILSRLVRSIRSK
jgi:hypothetical protein